MATRLPRPARIVGHHEARHHVRGPAQALAKVVLGDPAYVLARGVLDGGPFAMRRAEELAELVLGDARDEDRTGDEKSLR